MRGKMPANPHLAPNLIGRWEVAHCNCGSAVRSSIP